jgi:hypothetical protein
VDREQRLQVQSQQGLRPQVLFVFSQALESSDFLLPLLVYIEQQVFLLPLHIYLWLLTLLVLSFA